MKPPDQTQRNLIVEKLDVSMIVEAAAGTGKTTAMVNRMVALLQNGKCEVDSMAAVTFTRKAAAELQEKFQEKIGARAGGCCIGTVHSFCGRLLRERPVEAGVDPAFEELDEERDQRLREQSWDLFGDQLYAEDDPVLDELDRLGLTLADLRAAFLQYSEYPDVADWPAPVVPAPELKPAVTALLAYCKHMRTVEFPDGATDKLAGMFPRILAMVRSRDFESVSDVAEILAEFAPGGTCTQKNWPNGKSQALAEHERWETFCEQIAAPFLHAWRAHRYPTVLAIFERARAVYDRQRELAHGLNFQDLLMRAAQLLREHPEVRRYFRRRFTHVLVDEFQDTDPVQAEVMLLLTADNPEERDWRKCRPVPGSLFVVGDPKQSIYRFRRADIVTYKMVKSIIVDTGGLCVGLSANFRSAKTVVDWVNKVFEKAFFPVVADDFSPVYSEFQFAREDEPVAPGVFKLELPALSKQHDLALHEADVLARHIRGEIDRQARQAGDFLIVTCKKHRLSVYAAALARYGIAHEVTGGTALNEVSELGLLVTLVRAALEPDNPVAVVAALRSELFGVSDPELYAYRRAGGRFDFRAEATGTMGEAFEVLRRCADWLSALAPVIAVERIAGEIGLLAFAAADGEIAAGSLGKAMELLRSMPAELLTATDCVTQLERLVEHQPAHDGASMLPPKASAVRVMNLHKVKGLQAPVVFLADPSGESEHDVRLHVDRRQARVTGALALYGIAGQYGPGPLLAHPGNWEELAAREEQFQEAEYDRLLYVAVTRARDQLIVSQRAKPSDKNPWEPLRPALAGQKVLPDPGAQSAPVQEPAEVDVPAVAAARLALEGRWELARAASYAIRTAKPVAFAATPHAARGDGDGARWGSVIHLLLQSAMREPEAELEALAVSALRDADVEVARSGEAVAVVRKVAASKIWQRASAARQCLTEVPFIMAGKDGVVRGVIDLAFEEADGWVLVDYKTDMAGIEKLLETYRVQLENYRDCWRQIVGGNVKEVGIFATRSDRYGKLP